jgi:hypothetical protein
MERERRRGATQRGRREGEGERGGTRKKKASGRASLVVNETSNRTTTETS